MSLFNNNLFGDTDLGQVTLPEPASDALIRELATTGGSTTTPSTTTPAKAGAGFRPTIDTSASGGSSTWMPYALVGGGIVVAGVLIWSAMRRPTPNRRRARRRRRSRR